MSKEELDSVLEMLAALPDRESTPIWERRNAYDGIAYLFEVPDGIADITRVRANGVPGLRIAPEGADESKALLYLHGGGYVIGSPLSHRHMVAKIALEAGVIAYSMDYVMAPEAPYPAAVEDAVASYQYLLDQGFAPANIVISGDSAGGGLTMALLLAIRDRGLPTPAAAAPISPWVDMTASGESFETRKDVDPMISKEDIFWFADLYVPAGTDREEPLASPMFADLSGLPPLLIHVGDSEALLSDSIELNARAKAAGVDVTLKIYPNMIHVWHFFWPMLGEARDAISEVAEFIKAKTS